MLPSRFTIRVYGILINQKNQLLLTDEYIQGKYITKFPGGGLELGEGIKDCLQREWIEELNTKIEVKEHFYTNDFFIVSVFNPQAQVISMYYFVELLESLNILTCEKIFDFKEIKDGSQTFRFIDLKTLDLDQVTLLTDRLVCQMLKEKYFKTNIL